MNQINHINNKFEIQQLYPRCSDGKGDKIVTDHFLVKGKIEVRFRNHAQSTGTMMDKYEKRWCFKNFDIIVTIGEKWGKMRATIKAVS